jgi:hypothetical protein
MIFRSMRCSVQIYILYFDGIACTYASAVIGLQQSSGHLATKTDYSLTHTARLPTQPDPQTVEGDASGCIGRSRNES